jgi:hypothetical protein
MLDDRQHVEAVAIMQRMVDAPLAAVALDPEAWAAAKQWLRENRPEPAVYMAALASRAPRETA